MPFDLEEWRNKVESKLKEWHKKRGKSETDSIFASLSANVLWPVAEAARSGDFGALEVLESPQIAYRLPTWETPEKAAQSLAEGIRQDRKLCLELDKVLEKLDALSLAQAQLSKKDYRQLAQALGQELRDLGVFQADLSGSGAIAQGDSASAIYASRKSIAVKQVGGDLLGPHARKITHIHQGKSQSGAPQLRQAYLSRLMEICRRLSLSGIDPKAAAGQRESDLNLGAVYTALLTRSPQETEQARQQQGAPKEIRMRSALEQADRHSRLVLLGDPGSGKSTFVNFLALCLSGQQLGEAANLELLQAPLPDEQGQDQEEQQPWSHAPLLPVRVVLRDFAARGLPKAGKAQARHLWKFIQAELKASELGEYAPHLRRELREKGGLVLLDGLDEVPEARRRRTQIKEAVEDFARSFSKCRFLVTSRTYAYQQQEWRLDDFVEAVLAPFSRGQIIRFVDRWYGHIATLRGIHPDEAQGRAKLLKEAISGSTQIEALAQRPLLLTLMASLHAWRGGSLPDKREMLYADTVDLLLDGWESPKAVRDAQGKVAEIQPSLAEYLKVGREKVRELLDRLAFEAHAAQENLKKTADLPEAQLVSGLMHLSSNPEQINPAKLLEYLRDRAGLVLPRGVGVYTFPHRTFQEYLAACHLTECDYPDRLAELARSDPNRWREAALLAGAKAARGTSSAVWQLAAALCFRDPEEEEAGLEDHWGALMAGQALLESANLNQVSPPNQRRLERVRGWLVAILERGELPALERAAGGDVLAQIGDPRPGTGLRSDGLPDISWCRVPDGPFLMGSDPEKDPQARESEFPQRTVELPEYSIARYPITNRQFSTFVQDGGYGKKKKDCWTDAGWKNKGESSGPLFRGGVFDLPNHPAVMLNWYEAVAFCRWLTQRWRKTGEIGADQEVSLPTESQWEKAARGPDGILCPWEGKPEPERANYQETGLGATSAVGCFPSGASPYGCHDMAGNVREWCRTKWQDDYRIYQEQNDLEGEDIRVLRGCSYFNDSNWVRCAARGRNDPDYWSGSRGFRLVLSPSSLDSDPSELWTLIPLNSDL